MLNPCLEFFFNDNNVKICGLRKDLEFRIEKSMFRKMCQSCLLQYQNKNSSEALIWFEELWYLKCWKETGAQSVTVHNVEMSRCFRERELGKRQLPVASVPCGSETSWDLNLNLFVTTFHKSLA